MMNIAILLPHPPQQLARPRRISDQEHSGVGDFVPFTGVFYKIKVLAVPNEVHWTGTVVNRCSVGINPEDEFISPIKQLFNDTYLVPRWRTVRGNLVAVFESQSVNRGETLQRRPSDCGDRLKEWIRTTRDTDPGTFWTVWHMPSRNSRTGCASGTPPLLRDRGVPLGPTTGPLWLNGTAHCECKGPRQPECFQRQ